VAATAEQLMRSRYSAFAVGNAGYLLATWHSTTRPRTLELEPGVRWTRLDVVATTGGALLAAEGTVEFVAHSVVDGARGRAAREQPIRPRGGPVALSGRRLPALRRETAADRGRVPGRPPPSVSGRWAGA
jgi:SEC-C motif domain protein